MKLHLTLLIKRYQTFIHKARLMVTWCGNSYVKEIIFKAGKITRTISKLRFHCMQAWHK